MNKLILPCFQNDIESAMNEQWNTIQSILHSTDTPTFENTVVALELSGQALFRASAIFNNLIDAHSN